MRQSAGERTTWHITWGTYGARLHGDARPTVDRRRNAPGDAFVEYDPGIRGPKLGQMRSAAVRLTAEQRRFIQDSLPAICQRGGWTLRICAAAVDHVHVLLDADSAIHGEKIRRLLKRWLTQSLDERWGKPSSGQWWAEQGSNKAVTNEAYRRQVHPYIDRQRA